MSVAMPSNLTRKLSGRARAMFAEWTAAVLRQHAGEVGMDEAAQVHYRRRFESLAPRDRRRLKEATVRWEKEHPRLAASDEDQRDTPSRNRLATYASAHAAELDESISEGRLIEAGVYLGAIRVDLRAKALRDFKNGLIRLFLIGAMQREGGGAGAALSWTRDPLLAAWFALQSDVRVIRRATLAAADVAVYFPVAIIGATPPRDEREAADEPRRIDGEGLTEIAETLRGWVTEKSDELITTAVLESVALDEDEAQDLMDRVTL